MDNNDAKEENEMESKQAIEYEFDAEKVMGMTREDAISLLGDKNATRVNEGL